MFAAACCKLAPGVTDRNRVVNDPVAALDGRIDDAEFSGPAVQSLRVDLRFDGGQQGPAVRAWSAEAPRMRRISARTASVSAAWTIAMPRSRFISAAVWYPEGSSPSGLTPSIGYILFHISRHEMNSSRPSESQSLIGAVSQEAPTGASGLGPGRAAERAAAYPGSPGLRRPGTTGSSRPGRANPATCATAVMLRAVL